MNKKELTYILVVSILLTLSFPPFPFGFLAPVALAIFIHFMQSKSPNDGFRLGYLLGLVWGAMTLFWIASSTVPGAILAIAINAIHYAIVWWIFTHFNRKSENLALVSLPFIWVGMEYLRFFADIRFNWMTIANTQTYYLPFIQIVEITGMLGMSFILLVITILIYSFYRVIDYRRWIYLTSVIAIVAVLFIYGNHRIHEINNKSYSIIRAGLFQPNVDPYEKWNPEFQQEAFDMLLDASHKMVPATPQLIVWPETATPFSLRANPNKVAKIKNFVDSTGIHLLTGTHDYKYYPQEKDYHSFNSAFFFNPDSANFQYYYKMALVPASESMPFKETFPFLRKLDVGGGDFFPGDEFTVFNFKIPYRLGEFQGTRYQITQSNSDEEQEVGLSAVICFDSVFPHLVRQFVQEGANLLTIITNDGWFGLTSGPYQHAQYAVLRAVENRVSIVRCANTGISGFIDPTGRYLTRIPLLERGHLTKNLPLNQEKTFYTQHGDWVGDFTLIVSSLLIFISLLYYLVLRKRIIKTYELG